MKTEDRSKTCANCGMFTGGHASYHPYAACQMFRALGNGNTVEANIRAIVEYGMRAQRAGVELDRAMNDITWMHEDQ